MSEPKQAQFDGWAIVEIMGHQRHIGYVTTEAYGAAVLFRIDTPELPERDFELTAPEYGQAYVRGDGSNSQWMPAGAKVRRPANPASSALIGPGSIYRMVPCTEEAARAAIEKLESRPLILLEMPPNPKELVVHWPTGRPEGIDAGNEFYSDPLRDNE